MLLVIRQRRLRYLGHILRMPESRMVRRALVALAKGGTVYPKGSLFMDCPAMAMDQLVALAQRRGALNALPKKLHWYGLILYQQLSHNVVVSVVALLLLLRNRRIAFMLLQRYLTLFARFGEQNNSTGVRERYTDVTRESVQQRDGSAARTSRTFTFIHCWNSMPYVNVQPLLTEKALRF